MRHVKCCEQVVVETLELRQLLSGDTFRIESTAIRPGAVVRADVLDFTVGFESGEASVAAADVVVTSDSAPGSPIAPYRLELGGFPTSSFSGVYFIPPGNYTLRVLSGPNNARGIVDGQWSPLDGEYLGSLPTGDG